MARIPEFGTRTLILILDLLTVLISEIQCFNLDVRIPVVKQGEDGSLFGFSVAEHIKTSARPSHDAGYADSIMLVGSPKFKASQGLPKPEGGVFQCPLTSYLNDCQQIELNSTGNEPDDKSDQWLGVTVRSQGQGGIVAACAHRYKLVSPTEISGLGKCFLRKADLSPDTISGEWTPCKNKATGKKAYGYCQAGTGLHIAEPTTSDELPLWVAGIPGAGDWRGGLMATSPFIDGDFDNLESNLDDSVGVGLNSYLGLSVSSGHFDDGPRLFVAGAPKVNAIGAVVILKPEGTVFNKHTLMEGETLTESYGYAVCVADLNGDGYDDLIVGAPLYYDREAESGGRVYIYINTEQNGDFSSVEPIRLTGPMDSMFGIALANLGDINLDGYEDLAVGAPYENDGEGAVYIYFGASTGLTQPEVQKITPSDLPENIPTLSRPLNQTFGYALSGGLDLDGNGYPELLVGAFETDSIIAFRSRAIVSINASLTVSVDTLDPNRTNCEYEGDEATCFYIQASMQYRSESDFDKPLDVLFSIEAEEERRSLGLTSRVIFEDTGSYSLLNQKMTLRPASQERPKLSKNYRVIIRHGFKDIYRPIPMRLSFELDEKEVVMPNPGEPLPNMDLYPIIATVFADGEQPKQETSIAVDFQKECAKDDGECITDLKLTIDTHLEGEPPVLRVGEHDQLKLSVGVQNLNEEAYDAQLLLIFPEILEFRQFEKMAVDKCKIDNDNATVIICTLGNPYSPTVAVDMFDFSFDANTVPPETGNFTIMIKAKSTNKDSNPADNEFEVFIDVESVTDIQISGTPDQEQYFFGGEVTGESAMEYEDDVGVPVKHTWTVYNAGPGIVTESLVTIYFPYEVANGKWLLYMMEEPMVENDWGYCEVEPGVVNEIGLKERVSYSEVEPTDTQPPSNRTRTPQGDQGDKYPPGDNKDNTKYDESTNQRRRRSSRTRRAINGEEPQKKKDELLDCNLGTAKCHKIECFIDKLNTSVPEAKIIIKSRLWNSTFLEDYLEVQEVRIFSQGTIEILNAPFLTQINPENNEDTLVMQVKPGIKTLPPPAPLEWWIILLAVLGGLLLLILIILLLWKCGFFKRGVIPGTQSGGPCGFFERKTMAYKYASVTQTKASGKGEIERTAYYDEQYFGNSTT
ncbi:integrin alpha-6-like isoform X2 [Amphiura filiformis]|uniref:integrin alpha-6-like isoform X2 n=1 Tax=Amphiura filiformis TaxID=82378 RepID=UPI003B228703